MKKILRILVACGIVLFAACDEVSEDDRLAYRKPEKPVRSVLIEDFTGQRCSNCPAMADGLNLFADNYGHDNVVIVAHHSGNFSKRTPLRNSESQQILESLLSAEQAQPAVILNRRTSPVYAKASEVGSPLADLLIQYSHIASDIEAEARVVDGKIVANVAFAGDRDAQGVGLMVWVLENGIISYQFLDSSVYGTDYEDSYVHNHVFRKSMTPLEGDVIGDVVAHEEVRKSYTVDLDDAWNKDNLDVVVVVTKNGLVENVKKVKVNNDK